MENAEQEPSLATLSEILVQWCEDHKKDFSTIELEGPHVSAGMDPVWLARLETRHLLAEIHLLPGPWVEVHWVDLERDGSEVKTHMSRIWTIAQHEHILTEVLRSAQNPHTTPAW